MKLPLYLFLFVILFAISYCYILVLPIQASLANHVVISEIQIGSVDADDEFVELYNPTDSPVEMTGWRLTRRNATGGSTQNLILSLDGIIPAHGYFLIAHREYTGQVVPDLLYSALSSAMTADNIITLYSDSGSTIVDLVGLGSASIAEGSSIGISTNTSETVERKAVAESTANTLLPGGIHEFWGNGEDTENNNMDFVIRLLPNPQNSLSASETPQALIPISTPTPTVALINTPAPTPTQMITPTITLTPTSIPEVDITPTTTPQPEVTPPVQSSPLKGWMRPNFFWHQCEIKPFGFNLFSRAFTFYTVACTK
jgi:hypothetical protein